MVLVDQDFLNYDSCLCAFSVASSEFVAIILKLSIIFTKTEDTMMASIETKINPKSFSTSGGKISQLKKRSAAKRIAPIVRKKRRVTASDAVNCSIFLLSIGKIIITQE